MLPSLPRHADLAALSLSFVNVLVRKSKIQHPSYEVMRSFSPTLSIDVAKSPSTTDIFPVVRLKMDSDEGAPTRNSSSFSWKQAETSV